jgi:hypothetical protein
VGVDPAKNGGDLLWVEVTPVPTAGGPCSFPPALDQLALGSTGDIALGIECSSWPAPIHTYVGYQRFNGSGALFVSGDYYSPGSGALRSIHWEDFALLPGDSLSLSVGAVASAGLGFDQQLTPGGQGIKGFLDCTTPDAIGYCKMGVAHTLSPAGQLVDPPLHGSVPDGLGGLYVSGGLGVTKDLGCGPMVPSSPDDAYIAHLDASSACIYSHVLPAEPIVVADDAGAVLRVSSSASLDLGCGALPAAPGGSTFVTRLDPSGGCVFGESLPAPGLSVALDPSGSAVLSGLVDAASVDLGGGPLAPLGTEDIVLGELDVSGNHLWSKRFGGPGITFEGPHVTVSAAGDVYLRTAWSGSVDLGGGAITAASNDTVVGSYAPSGAHRWSRGFPIVGAYLAGVDGCGSLVVASNDAAFDLGQGKVLPPVSPTWNWQGAIARHAP